MSAERRAWALELLPAALGLLAFAVVFWGLEPRGCGLAGVWLEEASGDVARWLAAGAPLSEGSAAWSRHSALPPLTLALVGLGRWLGLSFFEAARALSALSLGLMTPMIWGLGRRAGGPPGAAAAVFAALLTPRLLGAATSAGFDAAATCGLVFAVYALYRARTSAAWTAAAPLALAVGALTSHAAWLLPLPWLVLTLSDKGQVTAMLARGGRDPEAPEGFLRAASVPPRLLLLPPLAALWIAALWPWLWAEPLSHLSQHFVHFLQQPHAPVLFLGERITSGRLPLYGSLALLLATLTPVTALLGAAGVMGESVLGALLATGPGARLRPWLHIRPDAEAAGPEAREAKRWAFALLTTTMLLPWLAGAPRFGPVDLLALAIPFWSVFVGCTVSRLFSVTAQAARRLGGGVWARVPVSASLALFGVLVFAPSLLVCARNHPAQESHYSWLVGGLPGALQRGLARNPGAPVPLPVARALVEQNRLRGGRATMAVLIDEGQWRQVLELYRRELGMGALPAWAPPQEADLLVLPHQDEDPAYFQIAPALARTLSPASSLTMRREGVRLVTLGAPTSAQASP